jgi:integrase/recombinase XerD
MLLHEYQFNSCFAEYIDGLIEQKKNLGYTYDSAKYTLIQFDKFCIEQNVIIALVTKELTEAWNTYKEKESKSRRSYRISVLRQLAEYMVSLGRNCYIPSRFTAKVFKMPYIMTDEEIRAFMKIADEYIPQINAERFNILAEEYKVLFRFIYCCGLRVSEARKLKVEDVDFHNRTAIIRHAKGDKDRLLYFADDVGSMCQDLINLLHEKHNFFSEYLFPSSSPDMPLQVASINLKFKEFWNKTSYARSDRHPTVHSLRYSFVVKRMN